MEPTESQRHRGEPGQSAFWDSQINDAAVVEAETAKVRALVGIGSDVPVAFDDEGWDSRVYLIDGGATVFKFARNAMAAQQYEFEVAALRLLESRGVDQVALPRVRWVDDDRGYFGYRGIVGESLATALPTLTIARRAAIGAAIGALLGELHSCELDSAPTHSIEFDLAHYAEKVALARPVLEAEFDVAERARLEAFVRDDLAIGLRRGDASMLLGHGDLGPWNVVVTDDGVGIIDFGDIGYHDPAKDFSGFGDGTITAVALDAYEADDAMRERAALRATALPLLDIPFFLGKGNDAGVRACVAAIRAGILGSTPRPTRRPPR